MRWGLAALLATVALAAASVAVAKDFPPGSVRVCGHRCLPLTDVRALVALSAFYYGPHAPAAARAPARGGPYVQLRYPDGYVTGVAAGPRFDRFLSFGVNLNQFAARRWYRIPAAAAAAIRLLAAQVAPRPLPATILRQSH